MAPTDASPVVTDAGPIIHLDELSCLDLLSDFQNILIPQAVWNEIVRHRPKLTEADVLNASVIDVEITPEPRLLALIRSLGLNSGETAALALMESRQSRLFLCDDAAARLAAESLGFQVHGTIGILVRSIRTGRRTRDAILTVLQDLPRRSTLHISDKLLGTITARI